MSKPLIILGSAEIAELVKFYFEHDSERKVVAFTVDDVYVKEDQFNCLPLVLFSEVAKRYSADACDMHVALSYARLNRLRQEKYEQAKAIGYTLPVKPLVIIHVACSSLDVPLSLILLFG